MKKRNSSSRSRRDFLKESLATLGLASVSSASLQAKAATAPRHHLINIVRKGGWDSLWFHNGVPQSEYQGLVETKRAISTSQSFTNPTGNILAPFAPNFNQVVNNSWTTRYPDSYIATHPDGLTTLGPGLNFMQSSDFANICIWRGIASSGGHNLGNQILQTGGLSGSLPSFSSAIAAHAISNGTFRKLHYVQLSGNSVELSTQGGAYSQVVQPINIPNSSSWQSLTSPPSNQLTTANRRTYLNEAISSLSSAVSSNSSYLSNTKSMFTGFLNSFLGGSSILSSNYGSSADFTATVQAYKTGITSIYNNHVFKTAWFSASGADNLATNGVIDSLSFRFALAEFLIKNDLSTVIDILAPGSGDFHNRADNECLSHLCLYAAYVLLVRRLKATASASGSSVSLLDLTTVVMHSEFERHPLISCLDEAHSNVPGTDHWDKATSIWLSGKGINNGKVIGDFKRQKFSSLDYKNYAGYMPLPVDAVTGQVRPDGIVPTIESLAQTMLSVFGALSFSKLNDVSVFKPVTKG